MSQLHTVSHSDVAARPARQARTAIVVGAGLAGMATAIGLAHAGFRVTLLERARALTPAGFGIGITTNGLQALALLGAYEPVAAVGCAAADAQIKRPSGALITTVPAKTVGDRVGMPTRIFHRAALQGALSAQLPDGCLTLDARCVAISQTARAAVVLLEDGRRLEADVLIGADGVNSTIRRLLHGDDPLRFAHYMIWLSTMTLSHPMLTPGYNAHYWGTGSRFGIHDIGGGEWYWWGTKNMARVPERLRNLHLSRCEENQADRAELRATFADFPDEVHAAIDRTPDERVFLVNTRDRAPLRSWSRGRVTLLGDAAHPMLTSLGQGAVMGFEDAAVLVRCLSRTDDVPTALRAYEQLRIPRTTSVVRATRAMSHIEQAGDPRAVSLRNMLFARVPTALAARQLEAIGTFALPDVDAALSAAQRSSQRDGAKPAGARRLAVVTGASSGIGRAIAVALAERGLTVFAGARSDEALRSLGALGHETLLPTYLDVTEPASIEALVGALRAAVADGATLCGVVNNAAVCETAPLEAIDPAALAAHLGVNVVGTVALTQATLPFLRSARGRIVNIGSNVGRMAPPFLGAYAASKAALEAMSDTLRRELSLSGVCVSLVVPGPVMTPVWQKIARSATTLLADAPDDVRARYEAPLRKFVAMNERSAVQSRLRPEDVAQVVARIVCDPGTPAARYELGLGAVAGTWLSRALPTRVLDFAFRMAIGPASVTP